MTDNQKSVKAAKLHVAHGARRSGWIRTSFDYLRMFYVCRDIDTRASWVYPPLGKLPLRPGPNTLLRAQPHKPLASEPQGRVCNQDKKLNTIMNNGARLYFVLCIKQVLV